ncbi:MAG: hypothetical protein IT293_16960 [Deltaproteobacteria bacterium]|nr:hypothetical protein [Deltaproteobacteria bacterium]
MSTLRLRQRRTHRAGYFYNGSNNDFAVVRYNSDGTLDGTFGSGGQVTTPVGTLDDSASALVVQSDGKLVAAGYSSTGSSLAFAVVRYNSDGTLDGTFGSGGIVTTPVGASVTADSAALVVQGDGKLVVAGASYNGSNDDLALVRYNTDGTLDGTFGTGGIVTTPVGSNYDRAHALMAQNDGKLVAAGYSADGSNPRFAVVRYNSDGTLDGTFGTGGKVTTTLRNVLVGDIALAIVVQSDDKLVVAGSSVGGSRSDFAVVRYEVAPDPTPTPTPTSTAPTPTATPPTYDCCSASSGCPLNELDCGFCACGFDPACCTVWTEQCARIAGSLCAGVCPCAAPSACPGGSNDPHACLDDFLCYQMKASSGAAKFSPVLGFALRETFELSADVLKTKTLCLPGDAGDGTVDSLTHHEAYQVKAPAVAGRGTFGVVDRFGSLTVTGLKLERLLVPSNKSLSGTPSAPPAATADMFDCYKAKISKTTPFPKGVQVTVTDQFETARLYDVKKPTRICFAASARIPAEPFVNPVAMMMCYQIKVAKGGAKHAKIVDQIEIANRFGTEQLDSLKQETICVPARQL